MDDKGKNKRIKFSIELPSVSLQNFIVKALKDEDYFLAALENPIGAMEGCGVNLDLASFVPEDFGTFFGALAGVKNLIEKKNIKDITFENIFGEAADIRGSYMMSEIDRGICQDFKRGALIDKGKMLSFRKEFTQEKGRLATLLKSMKIEPNLRTEIGGVAESSEKKETFRGYSKEWDNADAVNNKRSEQNYNKNFANIMSIEDIMRGPLIHPVDLAALASKLETFIRIEERLGQ